MQFEQATKKKSKLRIALEGPAGSGKCMTSLLLAKFLNAKNVGARDSEHDSLSKYADVIPFKRVAPDDHSLSNYLETLDLAKRSGFDLFIIDSLSHAWTGKGGALEQVDRMGGNKFTNGWKLVTPLQNQLVESMLAFPGHLIATMRSKMDYVIEVDQHTGKSVPKKIGLAPVQRDGIQYEFDVILSLMDGNISVTKSRCPALAAKVFKYEETKLIAEALLSWLDAGVELSLLDQLIQEIRFVTSREALQEVAVKAASLDEDDKKALRISYQKRLEEFGTEPTL
jgi:hypothetical protein